MAQDFVQAGVPESEFAAISPWAETCVSRGVPPGTAYVGTFKVTLETTSLILSYLFIGEMIIKIFALGFAGHKRSYLRDGWNVLDFTLVVMSIVDLVSGADACGGSSAGGGKATRALRALRALRPLRAVRRELFVSSSYVVFVVLVADRSHRAAFPPA